MIAYYLHQLSFHTFSTESNYEKMLCHTFILEGPILKKQIKTVN